MVWRSAPGFLALARPGSDALTISGPAADLWELLAADPTPAGLAATLAARYGADPAMVESDLAPVLDALFRHGFIRE